MRPTLTKTALQSKSSELSKQIEKLTKRKGELEKELLQSLEAIERRSQAISAAMLAGTDSTKDQESNRHEKAKADDLRSAISLADQQIQSSTNELEQCGANIVLWDFFNANDAVENKLLIAMGKFYEAIATFEEIAPLNIAVNTVGKGTNTAHYDETRQTMHVYHALEGSIRNGLGLVEVLRQIETGYPNYLNEIRAKFKK